MTTIQGLRTHGSRSFSWSRLLVLTALMAIGSAQQAHALPTQIGQFLNDGTQGFVWTNNGNTSADFTTVAGGAQVYFQFNPSLAGLNPDASGFIPAHAVLSAHTISDGYVASGQVNQPISSVLTLSIVADKPIDGLTNLMTATVSPSAGMALISGQNGSASLNSSVPGESVTLSSDFVNLSSFTNNALGLTLGGITGPAGLSFNTTGGRSILNSFDAGAIGNFSSDVAAPVVPEPASLVLLGLGCVVVAGVGSRKLRSAA